MTFGLGIALITDEGQGMEEEGSETTGLAVTDPEMRQLLGMFDVPAFARRGQELEFTLSRLHERLVRERNSMLDMVRVRIRQWSRVAVSPDDGRTVHKIAVSEWLVESGAEAPVWSATQGPDRKRSVAAKELVASVERFNRRWSRFLDELPVDRFNAMIDGYNRYYLLEKECAFGSARLAARSFRPHERLTPEVLRGMHPLLTPSP